jgi:hypothetical protein
MVPRMALLPTSGQVLAESDGSVVTIRVTGELDAVAGAALLDTVRHELDRGPARIDVDLRGLLSFNDDGTAALAEVRALTAGLTGGLHYRTEGGAGQDAFLAAFQQEPI